MSAAVLEQFRDRAVTIVGFGREAAALLPVLAGAGARVTISDSKPADELHRFIDQIAGWPVILSLGENRVDDVASADVVFLSPGVPKWVPAVEAAYRLGKPIWSETRLFFALCPAPIIGVTGSSGKTTTTSLIGHLLAAAGRETWVGGNIGTPLIGRVGDISPAASVVLELSSFQLQVLDRSPHIAVVTTITPDHLDVHRSFDEYVEAKRTIVRWQGRDDTAILNPRNEYTRRFAVGQQARVVWFGTPGHGEAGPGVWVEDGVIVSRLEADHPVPVVAVRDVPLRGEHNLANACAAIAACLIEGVSGDQIAAAIGSFRAPEHRLELVTQREGVRWFNDSIATSPERATAGIRSFDEPLIVIAGGRSKNLDMRDFGRLLADNCRAVLLVGEAAAELRGVIEAAGGGPRLVDAGTIDQAVQLAAAIAEPGDVVLLAPAYTSFDQFHDYAARGRAFKQAVLRLEEAS